MPTVSRLGYLAVAVDNLDDAIEFYTRFVRLEVTERRSRTAFLTGGFEHHWLRLEEGNGSGVKRVGYVVETEAELHEVRAKLEAAGLPYTEGGNPDDERVSHWLRFTDPGGVDLELCVGMFERAVAPMNAGISMQKFLHAAWATGNFDETTTFYQQVLGFKVSDWVEQRAGFFRAADRYHHSLVLIRAQRPMFNHFCIQVESLDDVMRARHNAVTGGVRLRDDLLRHAPSGSIGFYMKDEARGYAVEFCVGHPRIDDATHHPRVLQSVPETMNVWLAELPDHRGAGGAGISDGHRPYWVPGSEPAPGGGRKLVGT
jgi:2,3-dihydroxy-p-cumate/2,3-dihydroxybenzoate 3,4-dioxygenase